MARDEERELEELGLPVLHHGSAEVGRERVVEPGERLAAVPRSLGVRRMLAGEGLGRECPEKERPEEEREPVLRAEAPHPPVIPIARASAMPPKIVTR